VSPALGSASARSGSDGALSGGSGVAGSASDALGAFDEVIYQRITPSQLIEPGSHK
jgi:hypothetical protein